MDHEPPVRFNKSVAPAGQNIAHLQRISRYVANERSSGHHPPLRQNFSNRATDTNRIRTVRYTQARPGFGRRIRRVVLCPARQDSRRRTSERISVPPIRLIACDTFLRNPEKPRILKWLLSGFSRAS